MTNEGLLHSLAHLSDSAIEEVARLSCRHKFVSGGSCVVTEENWEGAREIRK